MMAVDTQFHVLAVDDSIIDRKLIERLLKSSSVEVTVVDSGSKALGFLGLHSEKSDVDIKSDDYSALHSEKNDQHTRRDIQVNLIITDYCMPGMTGYELLRKIKESNNLKDIPVVIMSSENVPARINRCLEEGAEEFFLKPVQLSDVDKLKPHLMRSKSKGRQSRDYVKDNNKRKCEEEDRASSKKSRTKRDSSEA